jgi:hypothetical protein
MVQKMPDRRYDEVIKGYDSKYVETPEVQQCLAQSVQSCVSQSVNRAAMQKSDVKICDDLSEEGYRRSCKSMVVLAEIQKSGDPKSCGALTDTDKRQCVLQAYGVKATNAKDPNVCQGIATDLPAEKSAQNGPGAAPMPMTWNADAVSSAVGGCQLSVIISTAKDPSQCQAISNQTVRTSCEQAVKMRLQTPAMPPAPPAPAK